MLRLTELVQGIDLSPVPDKGMRRDVKISIKDHNLGFKVLGRHRGVEKKRETALQG